jgi:ankyrin repeat protein
MFSRYLIEAGAHVNHANKSGHTPLMEVLEDGNATAVKILLAAGAIE